MLKYQYVGIIVMLQYYLSNHFKDLTSDFHTLTNSAIIQLKYYNKFSQLFTYGEKIIKEYFEHLKSHEHKDLSSHVLKAIEYINQNYAKPIKLSDVAKSIPLNKSYLSSQFKQEYQMSFKQYLNHYRINQSIHLIKTNSYSMTDIALLVGFENTNYFSTVFKKVTGVTPSNYFGDGNDSL